jgi:hypothetical protein
MIFPVLVEAFWFIFTVGDVTVGSIVVISIFDSSRHAPDFTILLMHFASREVGTT